MSKQQIVNFNLRYGIQILDAEVKETRYGATFAI